MTPNSRATDHVPEEPYTIPIGKADVKRPGRDLTIVTLSLMVHRALDAADALAHEGVEAEVLDLRGLVPLDRDAIAESVRRTRRLLVVDEDYRSFGMSGEVITTAIEAAFDYLDAPPARLAYPDTPIPYSRPLEQFCLPNPDTISAAARQLVGR
jgi:pyruvate dehydrogenase E1 component beta subunit